MQNRSQIQFKQICTNFNEAWKTGGAPKINDYLLQVPDELRRTLFQKLVVLEIGHRRNRGDVLDSQEYRQQYPTFADTINEVWAANSSSLLPTLVPSSRADTVPDSQVSAQLPKSFGRYRLERKLGSGGMADVYLAYDPQLDRRVALKVPRVNRDDKESLQRFARESRAVSALRHSNICPVYDVSEVNGIPRLAMAFIDGPSLAEFITTSAPLPSKDAAILVCKIAQGMAEAHRHGVLHRDLKPANVMLDRNNEPVIMDFGLAIRTASSDPRLTQSGAIVGTPAYMAPEQLNAEQQIGQFTDIYAVGVILYELLTGRRPFHGSIADTMAKVIRDEPPSISLVQPDVDPRLASICQRAMAKSPTARYQNMDELANALLEIITLPQTVLSHETPLSTPAAARPRVSNNWLKTVGMLLIIPLAAILGAVIVHIQTPEGTLVIEVNEPDAIIEVLNPAGEVEVTRKGNGDKIKIAVLPGRKRIRVTKDDFWVFVKDVQIEEDGELKIAARLIPNTRSGPIPADGRTSSKPSNSDSGQPPGPTGTNPTVAVTNPANPLDHPPAAVSTDSGGESMSVEAAVTALLKLGASVFVKTGADFPKEVRTPADIPPNPFRVVYITLLRNEISANDLQPLASLRGLESVEFGNCGIKDTDLRYLRTQTALYSLNLQKTPITDAGLEHLADLHTLRFLHLGQTKIGDAGFAHLKKLTNLQTLQLQLVELSDASAPVLAGMKSLESLYLTHGKITDHSVEVLSELPQLKILALSGNTLTDACTPFLANMNSLTSLDLDGTRISDDGLKSLAKLKSIEALSLGGTDLTDDGLVHLKELETLTNLSFRGAMLTGTGLKSLATLPLTSLNLEFTIISDDSLAELIPLAPTLESLHLSSTPLTDACIPHLKKLSNLRYLSLSQTKLSPEGLAALAAALPDTQVSAP